MTAPMFWPTRDARHAGILDIGLLGGAIYDPDRNSWKFAREAEGFRYTSSSPLTQMLSRERPWTPQPSRAWRKLRRQAGKANTFTPNNPALWQTDYLYNPTIQDSLAENAYEDFILSIYDPFQGNVCAVANFVGLPVVAAPSGPRGSDLAIILVDHKPNQQPPFNLIRPKSTLLPFLSPILQIAAPSFDCGNKADEQILIRTRESVTIVAPHETVPQQIARVQPEFIRTVGRMPSKPSQCQDHTIHAAISPYIPNTYALVGEHGRVAIWTRRSKDSASGTTHHHAQAHEASDPLTIIRRHDTSYEELEDSWRRCIWSAHPSNLIVTSRTEMELVDYRGPTAMTSLFQLRAGETIQALQENNVSPLTPFHTYIATSHQIACVDQRFPKRPLISTAHQMGRDMPCGLKTMDTIVDGSRYTTVLTWDMRNAGITAYNFSHGSEVEPPAMSGGAQELPSFHTHAHYTNTSELRNPLKRAEDKAVLGHRMYQAIKPPLMGLTLLPTSVLSDDDERGVSQSHVASEAQGVTKFSVLQYAATGAVYAQEIDMVKRQELGHDSSADQVLTSGNTLAINIAQENARDAGEGSVDDSDEDSEDLSRKLEILTKIMEASEGCVAPWKRGVKEDQARADKSECTNKEVREHVKVDVRNLMASLRTLLLKDRETTPTIVDFESKVNDAMEFIAKSSTSVTLYNVLDAVNGVRLSLATRNAIAQQIQNKLELDPYFTSTNHLVVRHSIITTWPYIDHDISTTIRGSEATTDRIQKYLEQLYPLPKPRVLDLEDVSSGERGDSEDQSNRKSASRQKSMAMDAQEKEEEAEDGVRFVWPSRESRQIRETTIRRMAQELALATMVIVKTMEPGPNDEPVTTAPIVSTATETTATSTEASATSTITTTTGTTSTKPPFRFKYLFQNTQSGALKPAEVKVSVRAQKVLDEWYTGDITKDFIYHNVEVASDDEEVDVDEAMRTQEEALIKKRARRERKEEKQRGTRMQDPSYNINAKGSASQPTIGGIITQESNFSYSQMYADEDGMFSAPVVVSFSQPHKIRTQPGVQSKAKPSMAATTTSTVKVPFSFSQPAFIGSGGSTSSLSKNSSSQPMVKIEQRSPVQSKSQPVGLFFSETTTMAKQEAGSAAHGSQSLSSSQGGLSSPLPPLLSQSSQDMFFSAAASQPVPGPFATKRIKGAGAGGGGVFDPSSKPKKKKLRTQGF
ncbi:TATA box-binding protein-associated factor RNA polymerase I subunit C [Linnemannia exigua]|uniref:TATA box-binding protein-associated factor RNA polymerase I subunit C n=1 Tax=Linnemannia exigua TaxID=604196 RepID=A0AAD4DJT3_9FUNG|nr:TATA box-binding protein-associated factor RNA polymerase I subunit C [Linnemannia exigua]